MVVVVVVVGSTWRVGVNVLVFLCSYVELNNPIAHTSCVLENPCMPMLPCSRFFRSFIVSIFSLSPFLFYLPFSISQIFYSYLVKPFLQRMYHMSYVRYVYHCIYIMYIYWLCFWWWWSVHHFYFLFADISFCLTFLSFLPLLLPHFMCFTVWELSWAYGFDALFWVEDRPGPGPFMGTVFRVISLSLLKIKSP